MTGLELFLVFVGVTTLTDKLLRAIFYLDEGGRHGRKRNKIRPS